ncbi:putative ABC transport system permease protein [Amycolatopsis xylanica]|uniref:Putative ABC transport system permease protein n=1 Tax=Amycolatopsis xylanica TaxID=589385 RepID=A0A1H3A669_9PSEU|nr:FtsX-like permease family protein [Amycolatopsis xylanica]SDX25222.1 putative ABC transport system permease protein [Amycolatopsis xylanica]
MLRMALRTLRLRKGGFLATFVAMFFGALIVMACGGLMETGIRTAVQPQRLAGAPIVVAGAQQLEIPKEDPALRDPEKDLKTETANLPEKVRLDASLVAKLRAVPGVEQVVADISFPAGHAVGHGWSSAALTPYTLTSGTAPGDGEVVVESGTVGASIDLPVPGRVESFRISGIAAPQHSVGKPSVFFSDAEAARLSGHPGYVDVIGVFAPVTTDLSGALRGTSALALTGDDRGTIEFPEAVTSGEALIVLAAVSGGLSVMVAMFVVGSTLALSVQQRMRELALLRAIGTTPRQLRRMVLGEAMLVSVLATGIAGLLGSLLGRWLFDQLVENGVVPPVVEFHQGWIPVVAAAGAATLAAFFGALLAANRAARTKPTEALREAGVQRHWLTPLRVIFAVLCFGGGSALAIVTVAVMTGPVAASTAGPAVMLWAIGLAMISPGVTKTLIAIVQWPLRALSGVSGRFAMLNARGRGVRIAAAVTPIMLATGIATANIYLQTTQAAISDQAFTENLRADSVISSPTGLDSSMLEKVKATPGVTAASEYVPSQVFILKPFGETDDDGIPVLGVTADGAAQTTAAVPSSGTLSALRGDTVAMPESLGHKVGDRLTVMLGDGAVIEVRVVAVFPARAGFESLLMPAETIAPHTTTGLAPQILVRGSADLGHLAQPGVTVAGREALFAAHVQGREIGAWVNYLLVGMIMAYTVISVVNTLVMGTMRRRREFGLQRLTGATRGQVLRMMGMEGVLIAVVGVTLGTIVSAGAIVPFCLVVSGSVLPTGPLSIYLSIAGIALALALFSTLVPTWAATRGRPAEAALADD